MEWTPRHLEPRVCEALDAFRVVVLHGARQCGKTTLARLVTEARGGTYATLDDDAVREAAQADPLTFLTTQKPPLAVDEIQLGGDRLIRMVKRVVDEDPVPGRFLLTGSTNFLTVPTISESLSGRVHIMRLWPFSEAEISREPSNLEKWFTDVPSGHAGLTRDDYLEVVCRGGYPEVFRLTPNARRAWAQSYVETVTQRDIVALANIRKATALPRLLRWAAANTAQEINMTSAGRELGIDRATISSYLEWLETVFLIHHVPAWSRNLAARATRRPKTHLTDTGLVAQLLALDPTMLRAPTATATGPLLESFVVNEIARQNATLAAPLQLSHYRDNHGREVDLILEQSNGLTVAVEIKATSSPSVHQLGNIAWFRDKLDAVSPDMFRAGLLLHTGTQSLKVGDRLYLVPISMLWSALD